MFFADMPDLDHVEDQGQPLAPRKFWHKYHGDYFWVLKDLCQAHVGEVAKIRGEWTAVDGSPPSDAMFWHLQYGETREQRDRMMKMGCQGSLNNRKNNLNLELAELKPEQRDAIGNTSICHWTSSKCKKDNIHLRWQGCVVTLPALLQVLAEYGKCDLMVGYCWWLQAKKAIAYKVRKETERQDKGGQGKGSKGGSKSGSKGGNKGGSKGGSKGGWQQSWRGQ